VNNIMYARSPTDTVWCYSHNTTLTIVFNMHS